MAEVLVQISGVLYDKLSRTERPVLLQGAGSLIGVGVGGGPIVPPEGGGDKPPVGIWPDPGPLPTPTPPIYYPPSIWPDPNPPRPAHPIVLPPEQVPPGMKPPEPPPAGTTTPVPPPEGSGGWPVQPVAMPEYVVMQYPGYGPIYVTPPATPAPTKK